MSTKDITNTPHDAFIKYMLSEQSTLIEFMQTLLPSPIAKLTDFESLSLVPGNFISEKFKKRDTDLLYQAKIAGKPSYFYILLEHQSTPDVTMPLRCARYITLIQERHMRTHKTDRAPFVFPLVFYNGEKKYHHPTDLMAMIDVPDVMLKDYAITKFHLADLHDIEDEDIRMSTWAGLMTFAMKHAYDAQTELAISQLLSMLELMPDEHLEMHGGGILVALFQYIMSGYRNLNEEAFMQTLEQSKPGPIRTTGMTFAERLEAREAKGEALGLQRGQYDIIRRLLKSGMSSQKVSDMTQMSLEEILMLESETITT